MGLGESTSPVHEHPQKPQQLQNPVPHSNLFPAPFTSPSPPVALSTSVDRHSLLTTFLQHHITKSNNDTSPPSAEATTAALQNILHLMAANTMYSPPPGGQSCTAQQQHSMSSTNSIPDDGSPGERKRNNFLIENLATSSSMSCNSSNSSHHDTAEDISSTEEAPSMVAWSASSPLKPSDSGVRNLSISSSNPAAPTYCWSHNLPPAPVYLLNSPSSAAAPLFMVEHPQKQQVSLMEVAGESQQSADIENKEKVHAALLKSQHEYQYSEATSAAVNLMPNNPQPLQLNYRVLQTLLAQMNPPLPPSLMSMPTAHYGPVVMNVATPAGKSPSAGMSNIAASPCYSSSANNLLLHAATVAANSSHSTAPGVLGGKMPDFFLHHHPSISSNPTMNLYQGQHQHQPPPPGLNTATTTFLWRYPTPTAASVAAAAAAAAFAFGNRSPRRAMLRRAVFSDTQRKGLEDAFRKAHYIAKPDRKVLAERLGLKDAQVKIWFQNRRMKWRNSKERENPSETMMETGGDDGEENPMMADNEEEDDDDGEGEGEGEEEEEEETESRHSPLPAPDLQAENDGLIGVGDGFSRMDSGVSMERLYLATLHQ